LADGGFVILWQSLDASWNGSIRGKVYDANGDAQGAEFQVNSSLTGEEYQPSVTALTSGFIVSWESTGRDGSDKGIYAQRYAANGASSGSAFLVNSYTEGSQSLSAVTALADGGFVITWQSSGQDGSGNGSSRNTLMPLAKRWPS
jgi:large repetitive protein